MDAGASPIEADTTGDMADTPARGAELLRWALGVTLGAVLVLAAFAPLFKPGRLHVQDMYVDQMGYITTARILVDMGELRNGVLMPSQIENPRFRPYMPGHFLALAASYALLGYGVFATLLPSLASYVLVALGTFLIGNRLQGRRSGALAAALFALFPAEITYAFTAMAELTFTLAGVTAFALFVHLPRRWWPFAPPILLALPFLFRETGALLILPMAALVWRARGLLPALLASAGSVATLYGINRWQIADGKLAASLAFVTEGKFNYYNAYPKVEPERTAGELLAAVGANVERNLGLLAELLSDWPGELMPIGLVLLLAAVPFVLVGGLRRLRDDPLPLGAGLLLVLVLVLTVALYDTRAHKLLRTALFTVPFVCLAVSGSVRPGRAPGRLRVRAALAVVALGASLAVCARAGERMTRRDAEMSELSARLAELHDESQVIIGPPFLAPLYAVEHYPVVWSFYAANLPTYVAIQRRYEIGTILASDPMPPVFLRTLGMRFRTRIEIGEVTFLVYQRIPGRPSTVTDDLPAPASSASPVSPVSRGPVAGRALAAWSLGVAAFATLVLCVYGPLFEPGRLHVQDMYVDQVGYVTTARILAETGELRNGVLFPARLDDPGFHVHMPGHSATLALAYRLFGYGVPATLLPSLLGFVLAAVGTFMIGNRLEGRTSGALAALLFTLFPANVAYAFTAMAELTFTLACVAAVAVFVHLPERRRWLAPPLLLVLPFLFRESGAFLIVPLALVILRDSGALRAAAATLGSVLSLWLVNRWQIASGKLPASLAWVTGGRYNYGDAFAEPPPALTVGEWPEALGRNAQRNFELLGEHFAKSPGELMPWCLYVLFAIAAVALAGGAVRARRAPSAPSAPSAPFTLGAGLLMLLVFVLSVTLYDVKLHKMMRSAMFTVPFGAVGVASAVHAETIAAALRRGPLRTRWIARIAAVLVVGAAGVASHTVAALGAVAMTRFDPLGDLFTARLEVLHDPDEVLVGGIEAAPYALRHYPVAWSLPPANEPTLEWLLDRLPVGTILTSAPLSPGLLERRGRVLVHQQGHTGGPIYFYTTRDVARRLRRKAEGAPSGNDESDGDR